MTFVSELEPQAVWRHFDAILNIPRGSGNEQAMREYVIRFAEQHGLTYKQDKTGNVVVFKPAAPGREHAATTIVQSHLDMVNDKNSDVTHDFKKDAIKPRRENGYLKATGTTLGSDNGIGVASMLALLESTNVAHGPLELLFTVDEETGLTGATNLADNMLTGTQLINTDSEEEGALYVGCAGGAGSDLMLPVKSVAVSTRQVVLKLKLSGLRGGHSGVDIHLQRGNAAKLLTRALNRILMGGETKFLLASLEGGNKHNAIPREAFATVAVAAKDQERFTTMVHEQVELIRKEYATVEPDLSLAITKARAKTAWSSKTTQNVLALISALPHGVQMMSNDIPGLVETSVNLAIVKSKKSGVHVHCSSRSSVASALQALRDQIRAIAVSLGAEVKEDAGYPGWKPDLNSRALQVSKQVYRELFGKEPEIKAIHAGLECGIIGEKHGGMDMVSMGPQIEFPHSPDERVRIASVADFYKLLTKTLEKLAA